MHVGEGITMKMNTQIQLCPLNINMHHLNVPRNLPLLRHVTQIKTQTLFQCYCVICSELDHSESTRKQYDPKSHTT